MYTYRFCLEFAVPEDVDISKGALFTDDPEPTPTMAALTDAIDGDGRWARLRMSGSGRSLFVCVALASSSEDEARQVAQEGVCGVVSNVIPGARFVAINATDP